MGSQFNWDNLNVGNYLLDHSQGFFEKVHPEHELGSQNEEVSKLNKDIPDILMTVEDKENVNNLNQGDDNACRKAPKNLLTKPLEYRRPPSKERSAHAGAPSAYKYAQIYEEKKKSLVQRVLNEEKKNRIFHSKPAPSFKIKASSQENIEVKLTAAITPKVLKRCKEMEKKRAQKIEEYMKQRQPQKFTALESRVVHEEPFKPKKSDHIVESQPFNLHVEKRLEERKKYNDTIKKILTEKEKQEEEEKRRREELLARELRKLTVFKAKPNPFK